MRLRAGPVAEDGGVGDEAGLRLPQVELVAGRLESEADPGIRYEVEADLMRRARRGAGDRAGKAAVDRAVEMTAQDAFDLRMAPDDLGKPDRVGEAKIVHVGDAGRKRRVGKQGNRGRGRLRRERRVEPGQPRG